MKQVIVLILLLFCNTLIAQKDTIHESINSLKTKIEHSTKNEQLKWLDSLTKLTKFRIELQYDSIVQQTITLALGLDDIKMATSHTSDRIDYTNNILAKPEIALKIFIDFLPNAEQLNDNNILARFYQNGGDCYYYIKDYKTSTNYYNKALDFAQKANNLHIEGLLNWYIGTNYSESGAFAKSSIILQKAIVIFQQLKDTVFISNIKNSLSILYSQNEFFEEAKSERNEAMKWAIKTKNYYQLSTLYFNASLDEKTKGNQVERIKYLELALINTRKSNRFRIQEPWILSSLVQAYSKVNNLQKATNYLKEIESNPKQNTEGISKHLYYEALMHFAFAKKKYNKALKYSKEHSNLLKERTRYDRLQQSEKFLADVYTKLGNEKKAFYHFKKYSVIKDSITNAQKTKALSYYQTIYETEKRDLIIKAQESDISLLNEKNIVKNQYIAFGTIGLFALFGFVLVVHSRKKHKQKQKLQQQFSHNLLNAQENERTRIAKELHDSVGQQLTLIKKKSQNADQEDITKLTHNALEEVRSISRGLYPAMLKQLGLKESIEHLVNEYDEETNLFFTYEIDDIDKFISESDSLNFYRFIQECLTNIVKHAEAKTVSLNIIKLNNKIETLLTDNGKGFDINDKKNKSSLGLKTMFERIHILKGELNIDSKLGKGTKILAHIPITK